MRCVRRSRSLFFLLPMVLGLSGCGGSGKLKIHPVHGRVLYGDQPVAGARVTFHSVDAPAPPDILRYPAARTDEHGHFVLTTRKQADGAPAGSYKVLIVWPIQTRSDGSGEGEEGDRLQGRYATPEVTPIDVTVAPGSNDLTPFAVK